MDVITYVFELMSLLLPSGVAVDLIRTLVVTQLLNDRLEDVLVPLVHHQTRHRIVVIDNASVLVAQILEGCLDLVE